MTLGILGVGHLAEFLVEGLRRSGDDVDLVLSPRSRDRADTLAARFGARVAASNSEVVEAADVVVLATRPDQALEALAGLPWRSDSILISVAAGVPLAALAPAAAPARVVRAMPLSCAALGESPTALYPDEPRARTLLERFGPVHALPDEDRFNAATVLGALYAWAFALIAEAVRWTEAAGVPADQARALVAGSFRGAGSVVLARPEEGLEDLLQGLVTPGGISEQGLQVLKERDALSAWSHACQTILDRPA